MREPPYQLLRSRRKTLLLCVNREAQLVVRAPMRLPETQIREFIRQKSDWINKKQQQIRERIQQHRVLTLTDGETVPFLGQNYVVRRENTAEPMFSNGCLWLPQTMTAADFAVWLKQEARQFIGLRTAYYAAIMNLRFTSLKISSARRRWGSCNGQNGLNFSFRLVMCPPFAVDYVVVHELAHIVHKNHSPAFWAYVASVMPNYRDAKIWLRDNHCIMDMI